MIPKYPYQVRVTYRVGATNGDKRSQTFHNFEFIDETIAFRSVVLRKANVIQVQTVMVLDEINTGGSSPHHARKSSR